MRRFLPTIVAVLYTLLWTPVVADVVRTEPWALMARPAGAKAKISLLIGDRIWWNLIRDAFRQRKDTGGLRWAVLIAVIAGMSSSLIINPLSAGLFDSRARVATSDEPFFAVSLSSSETQSPRIGDALYLRAATNLIFKVTTSAWNTDDYSVAPFWPSSAGKEVTSSARLTNRNQIWEANQDVIVAEVRCQRLTSISNSTVPLEGMSQANMPYMKTDDGCAVIRDGGREWCNGGVWGELNVCVTCRKLALS